VTSQLRDLFLPGANVASGLQAGDLVVLTAIESVRRDASATDDAIRAQTEEALASMRDLLAGAGGSFANLGRVTAYMRDAGNQRERVYDVWDRWFPDAADKPSFKILDAALPDGVQVRFDALALLDHTRRRVDIENVDARDPCVRIGPWLLTSRLHGTSPDTGATVEGLEAQARQAVRNGIRLVDLAGGSRADVTQVLGFGRDLSYEPTLRAVLAAEFGGNQPAYHGITTFVRPVLEVMVEVTAYIND
jgi:enamine deaminase RidA (YjgF/YER057c/UK114 family)